MLSVFEGLFLPFLGTALGAGCVFFMKEGLSEHLQKALAGISAGVMTAASFFSLLMPSLTLAEGLGSFSFVPAAVGFLIGMLFLLLCEHRFPLPDAPEEKKEKRSMLMLAVTIHNLPEGMAVGVSVAALLFGVDGVTGTAVSALALGIAIQNFPEGAIISLPAHAKGVGKGKSFLLGVLSGVVEPIGAGIVILASGLLVPLLPYLLSFAAGAMFYAVIEELIPEMRGTKNGATGTCSFAFGFVLMMILDVVFG